MANECGPTVSIDIIRFLFYGQTVLLTNLCEDPVSEGDLVVNDWQHDGYGSQYLVDPSEKLPYNKLKSDLQ